MSSRYELTSKQFDKIQHLLPGKKTDPGRTAQNNHQFINAVIFVLRSGIPWADLPPRYGNANTVHRRFVRWAKSGVWKRIFIELSKDKDNEYLMIDSTVVKAHHRAATYKKKSGTGEK